MRSSLKSPKRKRSSVAAPPAGDALSTLDGAPTESVSAASPALVVALASTCSVKDVGALKNSLCAVAESDEPVVFDAGSVERIDTATIQLLCVFVRDRVGRNQAVVWRGVSAVLLEAARLLGVQTLLALPPCGEC